MKKVQISELQGDVQIVYNNKNINLPLEVNSAIDKEWTDVINISKKFTRGEIFSVEKIDSVNEDILITVALTDYAHYLYTIYNEMPKEYACRVVYAAILVETSDKKFVFGQMAQNTSTPDRLQCCGGGIDNKDLYGNVFNLRGNVERELLEELGISINDPKVVESAVPRYIKTGGENNFIAIIYKVKLAINEHQLKEIYNKYIQEITLENITPEFSSLEFVEASINSVKAFIETDSRTRVDYLADLLKIEVGIN